MNINSSYLNFVRNLIQKIVLSCFVIRAHSKFYRLCCASMQHHGPRGHVHARLRKKDDRHAVNASWKRRMPSREVSLRTGKWYTQEVRTFAHNEQADHHMKKSNRSRRNHNKLAMQPCQCYFFISSTAVSSTQSVLDVFFQGLFSFVFVGIWGHAFVFLVCLPFLCSVVCCSAVIVLSWPYCFDATHQKASYPKSWR